MCLLWESARSIQFVEGGWASCEWIREQLHKGYKTRDDLEEAYSQVLSQQACYYVPPHVDVHEAPPNSAGNGQDSLKNIIIVILVIWIMYLMRS
jgi:hypothetical protein